MPLEEWNLRVPHQLLLLIIFGSQQVLIYHFCRLVWDWWLHHNWKLALQYYHFLWNKQLASDKYSDEHLWVDCYIDVGKLSYILCVFSFALQFCLYHWTRSNLHHLQISLCKVVQTLDLLGSRCLKPLLYKSSSCRKDKNNFCLQGHLRVNLQVDASLPWLEEAISSFYKMDHLPFSSVLMVRDHKTNQTRDYPHPRLTPFKLNRVAPYWEHCHHNQVGALHHQKEGIAFS